MIEYYILKEAIKGKAVVITNIELSTDNVTDKLLKAFNCDSVKVKQIGK